MKNLIDFVTNRSIPIGKINMLNTKSIKEYVIEMKKDTLKYCKYLHTQCEMKLSIVRENYFYRLDIDQ